MSQGLVRRSSSLNVARLIARLNLASTSVRPLHSGRLCRADDNHVRHLTISPAGCLSSSPEALECEVGANQAVGWIWVAPGTATGLPLRWRRRQRVAEYRRGSCRRWAIDHSPSGSSQHQRGPCIGVRRPRAVAQRSAEPAREIVAVLAGSAAPSGWLACRAVLATRQCLGAR